MRRRFATTGMEGLTDRPRTGRPRRFSAVQVAAITALACTPARGDWDTAVAPEQHRPGRRGRHPRGRRGDLAVHGAPHAGPGGDQTLAAPILIFPRDPDFEAKARVLDLYARSWQGDEFGPDDYVISPDEKSQLQALHRRHPGRPPGPGRPRQVEFEYRRGGTLAYFAAYDVHQARVMGAIAPKTGIVPFTELVVAHVMSVEPYARHGGCSGSWTTAPPTPDRPRSTA